MLNAQHIIIQAPHINTQLQHIMKNVHAIIIEALHMIKEVLHIIFNHHAYITAPAFHTSYD